MYFLFNQAKFGASVILFSKDVFAMKFNIKKNWLVPEIEN